MKKCCFGLVAVLAFASLTVTATAQTVLQPEPAPRPAPVVTYPAPVLSQYGPPPPVLRPTAYSFNGPSPATVGYVTTTTAYYPGPGNRTMATTIYTPVYGYYPGYYSNYYTPLYFRP
jgi:hypothetical protein